MTKRRKFLLASVLSMFTLGSIAAIANPGGFGMHGAGSEKRAEFMIKRMTSKLDLNETQAEKLKAVQQQFAERRKAMKNNQRGEFLALLDAPELNQTQALSLLENRGEQIRQNAPEMIAAIAEFTNSLNNDQREKLKQMLEKFPGRGGFGKHLKQQ